MSYSQDFSPADAVYAPSSDGLILNIIGFAWTPEFISEWQSGGRALTH